MVDLVGDDKGKLKPDVVNVIEDDEDRIPIRDMLAKISISASLSICGPRLELRDKDLKVEEF